MGNSLFTYVWGTDKQVMEGLGTVGVAIEGLIAVPQAYRNYTRGDTKGLSMIMILGWIGGDGAKLLYYATSDTTPVHFIFSAVFQLWFFLFFSMMMIMYVLLTCLVY